MAPPARTAPGRSRRSVRPTGDDREAAILATLEALLGERPLADISVDDLASGAGISRPTFYFYFPSKDAVLLALLDRVTREAETALRSVGDLDPAAPRETWRAYLASMVETFRRHRAVVLAGAAVMPHQREVRDLWSTVMTGWVGYTVTSIEAERGCGAAPAGLPAQELAIALNSMNERVIQRMLADEAPTLAPDVVVDVLLGVWMSAIYGTTG